MEYCIEVEQRKQKQKKLPMKKKVGGAGEQSLACCQVTKVLMKLEGRLKIQEKL